MAAASTRRRRGSPARLIAAPQDARLAGPSLAGERVRWAETPRRSATCGRRTGRPPRCSSLGGLLLGLGRSLRCLVTHRAPPGRV
jgi:hypothetical protein